MLPYLLILLALFIGLWLSSKLRATRQERLWQSTLQDAENRLKASQQLVHREHVKRSIQENDNDNL